MLRKTKARIADSREEEEYFEYLLNIVYDKVQKKRKSLGYNRVGFIYQLNVVDCRVQAKNATERDS